MLTILDKYILKRYLATFVTMLMMFVPIGIIIDISEKINFLIEQQVPLLKIAIYYFHFTVYFANALFPIFLFLSIIWFTSKLANNTEIVAILSSGISFQRFLRPYIIGAAIVSVFVLLMGFYVVPISSEGFNDFRTTYYEKSKNNSLNENIFSQINANEFLYVNRYDPDSKTAFDFSLEKFDKEKLVSKIYASSVNYNPEDKTYTLNRYKKRTVGELNDKIEKADEKVVKLNIDFEDLTPVKYMAEILTLDKLIPFIEKQRARGASNINVYLVVLYKKFSIPVSAFVLTIIAVSVSAMKRRGGMGLNLTIGIAIAFGFVFFDKVFGILAEKSSFSPLLAVWLPNVFFGILAYYLLQNAKK
jgi:lipopolysaccharide export system permease protein